MIPDEIAAYQANPTENPPKNVGCGLEVGH